MSVLNVLSTPGSKQAQIKFNKYKYRTQAQVVIDADFEVILEPFRRQVSHITYLSSIKFVQQQTILPYVFITLTNGL